MFFGDPLGYSSQLNVRRPMPRSDKVGHHPNRFGRWPRSPSAPQTYSPTRTQDPERASQITPKANPSSVRPSQSSSMPLHTSTALGWMLLLVSSQSSASSKPSPSLSKRFFDTSPSSQSPPQLVVPSPSASRQGSGQTPSQFYLSLLIPSFLYINHFLL